MRDGEIASISAAWAAALARSSRQAPWALALITGLITASWHCSSSNSGSSPPGASRSRQSVGTVATPRAARSRRYVFCMFQRVMARLLCTGVPDCSMAASVARNRSAWCW
jgi:hypothetical protein